MPHQRKNPAGGPGLLRKKAGWTTSLYSRLARKVKLVFWSLAHCCVTEILAALSWPRWPWASRLVDRLDILRGEVEP